MPVLVAAASSVDRTRGLPMCFSTPTQVDHPPKPSFKSCLPPQDEYHHNSKPILPGLPDDVAKYCLALVPRSSFPVLGAVCKQWRDFVRSTELTTVRMQAGKLEEWLYVLTGDDQGKGNHWEVLHSLGGTNQRRLLPNMPGPLKAGFGVVVLDWKLLVIAGYTVGTDHQTVCADVYQYDSRLNSWSMLAHMNVARRDFACAQVNGLVYAVGGYGSTGESLSCAEVYDPHTNTWTLITSLRRPRWGCFACAIHGKLYVMGGRSSFTIGNSRFVDIYDPDNRSWIEAKNGCVMVTAHAVLQDRLFCIEWKNQRKLAVFDPAHNSWRPVPVPVTGSSTVAFRFGILDGKLLLFALKKDPGYKTLLYDPAAPPGCEWNTSALEPSGVCLCSVTIKA